MRPLALLLAVAVFAGVDYEAMRTQASKAASEGKLKQARSTLKHALADLRSKEKKPTQVAADLLGDLGGIYRRLDQQAEAVAAFEEASEVLLVLHGPKDPRYSLALDKLGDMHVEAQNFDLALTVYKNILDAMRVHLGTSHPGYEPILAKAASAALQAGKPRSAAKKFKELLGFQDRRGPPPAGQEGQSVAGVAQVRIQYARSLAAIGALEEALRQANQAQEAYAAESSLTGSFEHAASFNGLAGVLEKLNRDEEAVSAMAKALEIAQGLNEPEWTEGARRNLAGLKAHVARKADRRQSESQARKQTPQKQPLDAHEGKAEL